MLRIGITGPTGAGKTTALRVLAAMDTHIIDADAVYHDLLATSAPLCAELTGRFGAEILDKAGKIDRKALGRVVFGSGTALSDLNEITHRFILEEIDRQAREAERLGRAAVAVDAIALVESGAAEHCDAVVAVLAPKELRIRRIMAREHISEEYARARAEAQQSDAFFRTHSGYQLENGADDTPERFAAKARTLFEKLLNGTRND